MTLEADAVRILGLDYAAGEFSSPLPEDIIDEGASVSILLLHDTLYPVVDENGSPIHRNDPDHLDLRAFLDSADTWLDLIISGHLHVGSRGSIAGYETSLLVTGPTAEISKLMQENNPSTWLMAVLNDETRIERQQLT